MIELGLERVEALELLGMTMAAINRFRSLGDLSPRTVLLVSIRDKLAQALREGT